MRSTKNVWEILKKKLAPNVGQADFLNIFTKYAEISSLKWKWVRCSFKNIFLGENWGKKIGILAPVMGQGIFFI